MAFCSSRFLALAKSVSCAYRKHGKAAGLPPGRRPHAQRLKHVANLILEAIVPDIAQPVPYCSSSRSTRQSDKRGQSETDWQTLFALVDSLKHKVVQPELMIFRRKLKCSPNRIHPFVLQQISLGQRLKDLGYCQPTSNVSAQAFDHKLRGTGQRVHRSFHQVQY